MSDVGIYSHLKIISPWTPCCGQHCAGVGPYRDHSGGVLNMRYIGRQIWFYWQSAILSSLLEETLSSLGADECMCACGYLCIPLPRCSELLKEVAAIRWAANGYLSISSTPQYRSNQENTICMLIFEEPWGITSTVCLGRPCRGLETKVRFFCQWQRYLSRTSPHSACVVCAAGTKRKTTCVTKNSSHKTDWSATFSLRKQKPNIKNTISQPTPSCILAVPAVRFSLILRMVYMFLFHGVEEDIRSDNDEDDDDVTANGHNKAVEIGNGKKKQKKAQ